MIKPQEHFHGSDLEKIEKVFNIKKEDITSFSANVNPLGVSPLLKSSLASHIDSITTYPDREYTALRKAMGSYTHTDFNNIIVGNGSTELISLFIKYINPKNALLIEPTYSEYGRELNIIGANLHQFMLSNDPSNQTWFIDKNALENRLKDNIDMLIICNPNNPTGSAILNKDLEGILTICKNNNIFVMIDETYVEFAPNIMEVSAISLVDKFDNFVVLRGISKFFAAPGLRLGYAVSGNQTLLSNINESKNPWTINTLAAIAGEIMFSDEQYINNTKTLIHSEIDRITNYLNDFSNLCVYKTYSNFMLIHILNRQQTSNQVFEYCIKKGLMIRDCQSFEGLDNSYIRFCIMSAEKNDELLSSFAKLFS